MELQYTMAEIQRLAMEKYHSQTAEDWEKQFNKMLRFANDQRTVDEKLFDDMNGDEDDMCQVLNDMDLQNDR